MGKRAYTNFLLLSDEKSKSFLKHARGGDYDGGIINELVNTIQKLNSPTRVALDVGASYGFVSKGLSQIFDRVIASEVVPNVRHVLEQNVTYANMPNVEVLDFGFGDKEKEIEIWFDPRYGGHASVFRQEHCKDHHMIVCPIKTIDSMNFDVVDYIKIDVEGYELEVIKGAIETIKRCKPIISIEVSLNTWPHLQSSHECGMILEQNGYEYHSTAVNDFIFIPKEENT